MSAYEYRVIVQSNDERDHTNERIAEEVLRALELIFGVSVVVEQVKP